MRHLRRCVELASESLDAGDDPFGSVLTDATGQVLAEARNRERSSNDPTAHPELELAHWRSGWGLETSPVAVLPVTAVAPGVSVGGPVAPFDEQMRALHHRAAQR